MEQNIDLSTMTDVKELKSLKADQYDERERAVVAVRNAERNIDLISARIVELETKAVDVKKDSK